MLASDLGGGLFAVARDRLVAIVGEVRLVKCPVCGTENEVKPRVTMTAVVVEYSSSLNSGVFSGAEG